MARAWAIGLLLVLGLHRPVMAEGGTEAEPVAIGVMEFTAKGGITQQKANVLADVLAEAISSLGNIRVVTKADIQSMLDLKRLKHLMGCSESECFAEISGALGIEWMVTGSVGVLGRSYLLNLKLMDTRSVLVAGRVARRVQGGEEELLEELPGAVRDLFAGAASRMGLDIQERVTVASRYPQPLSQSPSSVWVITRDDIEASGADSIPNLLRLVPGMNVIFSSSAFQSITSRLHWTNEGNHYLVMIDGREINFDPLGFPVWEAEPIFLGDIERIEVIRGPASALYGANAFAGVVSITTREMPRRNSARIFTNGGEPGMTMTGLRTSSQLGDWGFAVSGGVNLSGEFANPREPNKRVLKVRALAERRWSESRRFLIDAGISHGQGPQNTPLGTVESIYAPDSVRLAYESENLRWQLYWIYAYIRAQIDTPLEYAELRLANFVPTSTDTHVVDAQLQWTPRNFWEPLMLVVGGGARFSWMGTDHLLDAETFTDPASSRYGQPGITHWEIRSGVFVHAEYALFDWITVTGGTRIDYNTQTEWFVSPRLAAVLRISAEQYLRVGVARSFRKPSFIETVYHPMVEFPEDSPIQGTAQDRFQEFMTRVGGYSGLENEELLAFEAGYVGRFLDGRLSVCLDLYYNQFRKQAMLIPNIIEDEQGLPDLGASSFLFRNQGPDLDILGSELSVRFNPYRSLSLMASWTHRQIYDYSARGFSGESPKNLITLGGRFRTGSGLLGSLYVFTRSEFWDLRVENPAGILEPMFGRHMDNVALMMGKLGWQIEIGQHVRLETGVKLFLPVSPFSAPHFRYYEAGGGMTPVGKRYGAEQLGRMLTGYLEGSF
jgi:outer membrane receptor protein involved in Fe transport